MISEISFGFTLHKLPYVVVCELLPCGVKLASETDRQGSKVCKSISDRPSRRKALYRALTSDAVGIHTPLEQGYWY